MHAKIYCKVQKMFRVHSNPSSSPTVAFSSDLNRFVLDQRRNALKNFCTGVRLLICVPASFGHVRAPGTRTTGFCYSRIGK